MDFEAKFPHFTVILSGGLTVCRNFFFFPLSCPLTIPRMGRSVSAQKRKSEGIGMRGRWPGTLHYQCQFWLQLRSRTSTTRMAPTFQRKNSISFIVAHCIAQHRNERRERPGYKGLFGLHCLCYLDIFVCRKHACTPLMLAHFLTTLL